MSPIDLSLPIAECQRLYATTPPQLSSLVCLTMITAQVALDFSNVLPAIEIAANASSKVFFSFITFDYVEAHVESLLATFGLLCVCVS